MRFNTALDPELAPLARATPPQVLTRENIATMRDGINKMFAELAAARPAVAGVTVRDAHIPGPEGEPLVRVRIYEPTNREPANRVASPVPGLFWIHGGGYVAGLPEQDDPFMQRIVGELGCVAVSVEYRLAPEHPYPAALEDCYAGLQWLFAHGAELGVDPGRIAIGGASAGGGLAAALGLLVRDKADMQLAFQLLLYPMLDDRNTAPASDDLPDAPIWSRDNNRFGWTSYLDQPPGGSEISQYAAAARADDLRGLPPTFMAVGDADLFVEEDMDYARRLIRAGVPVELHVYPGAFHGFDVFVPDAGVSQRLHAAIFQALGRTWGHSDQEKK